MAGFQTKVSVANLALSHVGQHQTLTTVSPSGGKMAALVDQFWQQTLDEITAERDWSFAISLHVYEEPAALPPEATPPPYIYGFSLPSLHLRTVAVYPKGASHGVENLQGYDQRGNQIYCKVDAIELEYVQRQTLLTYAPSHFVTALSYKLAYHLAVPVTKSIKLKNVMMQAYLENLSVAWGIEVRQRPPQYRGMEDFAVPSSIAARG